MDFSLLMVFVVAGLASFLGTLPFGPINLSVVDTTLNRSLRAALRFSMAAALVEIVQSWIAVRFSWTVGRLLTESPAVKLGAFLLFLSLGVFFFLKKNRDGATANIRHRGDFLKGLIISFLNPQAIPFWIAVLTYLDSYEILHLDTHSPFRLVVAFLLGVSVGKFAALALFGFLSQRIAHHSGLLARWINKIIGLILFGIALLQVLQLLGR